MKQQGGARECGISEWRQDCPWLTSGLLLGAAPVSLHECDVLRGRSPVASHHVGNVIKDHDPIEIHFPKRAHHLVHIHVTVVNKGLDKVRQGRADVAEMRLEDLSARAEVLYRLQQTLAGVLAAFTPPLGELNSPLHHQTLPLPAFHLTSLQAYSSL